MKAFLFTKMAWNNLRRYRRRTILVGLTILLSSAVLIFNNSLGNGIEEQLIQNMVYIQTGHIVLTPQADSRDPATETVRWQPLPPGLSTFLAS